jgi:hypothetical protein
VILDASLRSAAKTVLRPLCVRLESWQFPIPTEGRGFRPKVFDNVVVLSEMMTLDFVVVIIKTYISNLFLNTYVNHPPLLVLPLGVF